MARWGRCDYRELKKLDERLQQLSEVDMDRLCRDAAKKIAQILLNKVKKRTPVGVVPPYATDEAKEEYYKAGNTKIANNHTAVTTAVWWGLRSPIYSTNGTFVVVWTDGNTNYNYANYSGGLRPGFAA